MTYTFEVDVRRIRPEGYDNDWKVYVVEVEADNEVAAELAACQIAARHGMPIASRPIV